MLAVVASRDGSRSARGSMTGSLHDPEELGRRLAAMLEAEGARELLDSTR
jgi:porphobilinogen deaminase